MPLLPLVVNISWSHIRIHRLFLIHRMIRLMSRRGRAARHICAILIAHFMGIDLPRWLPVLHGLRCAIGFVGGCGFVVVQTPHAAFGLWLGPLIAAARVGNRIGHGNLHGE